MKVGTIDFIEPPEVDGYGTVTVGRWGGWLVQIVPTLFNDRLVLTPEDTPIGYDYGWCFNKGGFAYMAALAWRPEVEAEPAGYTKAINIRRRKAGEVA